MRQAVKGPCYLQQQDQIPSWELNLGCDTNWPSKHSLILIISWSFICVSPAHTQHDRKTIQMCVKSQLSCKREFFVCVGFLSHTYSISHVATPT